MGPSMWLWALVDEQTSQQSQQDESEQETALRHGGGDLPNIGVRRTLRAI